MPFLLKTKFVKTTVYAERFYYTRIFQTFWQRTPPTYNLLKVPPGRYFPCTFNFKNICFNIFISMFFITIVISKLLFAILFFQSNRSGICTGRDIQGTSRSPCNSPVTPRGSQTTEKPHYTIIQNVSSINFINKMHSKMLSHRDVNFTSERKWKRELSVSIFRSIVENKDNHDD